LSEKKQILPTTETSKTFQMGSIVREVKSSKKDFSFVGFVKIDNLQVKIARKTHSIFTWFAAMGGSIKALKSIAAFFILNYVKRDLFDKIMGSLFMVKRYGKYDVVDDCANAKDDADHVKGDGTGHLKQIRFCNEEERKHYKGLKKELKEHNVKHQNMINIVQHMAKNRIPYDMAIGTWRVMYEFIFSDFYCWFNCVIHNLIVCICPACARRDKKSKEYRYNRLFMNGVLRYFGEVDIVKLLQSIR